MPPAPPAPPVADPALPPVALPALPPVADPAAPPVAAPPVPEPPVPEPPLPESSSSEPQAGARAMSAIEAEIQAKVRIMVGRVASKAAGFVGPSGRSWAATWGGSCRCVGSDAPRHWRCSPRLGKGARGVLDSPAHLLDREALHAGRPSSQVTQKWQPLPLLPDRPRGRRVPPWISASCFADAVS